MLVYSKLKKATYFLFFAGAMLAAASCGGGSGGGGDGSTAAASGGSTLTIQGTFRSGSAASRVLSAGEGGIAGVQISALGDSATTDELGNFSLVADGNAFSGGAVSFSFSGPGINETVPLEGVLGGPGATAYNDFVLEDSGEISGVSTDAAGNVLGRTPGGGLGCSQTLTFLDGGGGALWKPLSERTGTVVILMPAEYRSAEVAVFNSRNEIVDGPLIRDCCDHNGGREHIYLTRSSGDLAGAGTPLTVRFQFGDGFTDCRTVPDPNQRYD
jgi:hypothetical protein